MNKLKINFADVAYIARIHQYFFFYLTKIELKKMKNVSKNYFGFYADVFLLKIFNQVLFKFAVSFFVLCGSFFQINDALYFRFCH